MDTSNQVNESLRDWFGKSKSKGGKPGWVQSDGSPCANEKGETKGSGIKGPVSREAAERWPRIAAAATTIV